MKAINAAKAKYLRADGVRELDGDRRRLTKKPTVARQPVVTAMAARMKNDSKDTCYAL